MLPRTPPLSWLFVDMNSFFAAVEQHQRPELRGRAVAVVPVESDSTCVIAASREAKLRGVKTGTGVRDARRLCPGIQLVRARPAEYVRVHHAILRTIDRCAPVHKVYSIDEWAIRLLGRERDQAHAEAMACRMKACLLEDFSPWLTCSIGIAPTRLLAKIACDLHKPDGLTVLHAQDLPGPLEHLPLQSLCGIGGGMAARLEQRGVRTVRDLWNLDRRQSIEAWGSIGGAHWWAGFHGVDEPEVPTSRRSMTHASVLDPRFRNETGARGTLVRLITRLGVRLRTDGYLANRLSIFVEYVRSGGGGGWGRGAGGTGGAGGAGGFAADMALPSVQDTPSLLEAFYKLWSRRRPCSVPPIKVGATVSGLVLASQEAPPLFARAERPLRLSQAIDAITRRWGLSAMHFGAMHGCHEQLMEDKIAFGRIPTWAGAD